MGMEASLNSNSERSKHAVPEPSVIPNNVSTYSGKKPSKAFRTPANRRKSTVSSNRISSVGLLQQKAAELQQHHPSHGAMSRNYMNRGSVERNAANIPVSRSPALGAVAHHHTQYHHQQQYYQPEH